MDGLPVVRQAEWLHTQICTQLKQMFDLGGLQDELESLLGFHVDLLTPTDVPPKFRAKVLAEAQPV